MAGQASLGRMCASRWSCVSMRSKRSGSE